MSVEIFTLTLDGNLSINKPAVLTRKSFRTILSRDKSTKGYKERAFKEFAYIYHFCDLRSDGVRKGYGEEKRHILAVEAVGLPEDWLPDEVVKQAIEDWKSEQEVEGAGMIRKILEIFQFNEVIIDKAKKTINRLLLKDELNKEELIEILNMNKLVFNFSKEIPELSRDLHEILKRANLEVDGEAQILRGTEETVPDSYDPDRSL